MAARGHRRSKNKPRRRGGARPASANAQAQERFQDSDTCRLINVEERAKASPSTFLIPPRGEREALPIGSFAMLIFRNPQGQVGPMGERLWVRVTEVSAAGRYQGVIDNDPVVFPTLRCGMAVAFGSEHIAGLAPSRPSKTEGA